MNICLPEALKQQAPRLGLPESCLFLQVQINYTFVAYTLGGNTKLMHHTILKYIINENT